MKMIEALKEEIKNSPTKAEERANKKLEENNKSRKGSKESQEKTIKQVNKMVQDLKTDFEAMKKKHKPREF